MARSFTTSGDALVARLDSGEIELLETLVAQLLTLVRPDADAAPAAGAEWAAELGLTDPGEHLPSAPSDPAVARLFPDAHRDDPLAAADFRRLMEPSMRQGKADNAQRVLDVLHRWRTTRGKQRLSRPEARSLMVVLTDLRLVMAQRLGIETDEDTEQVYARLTGADPDSPEVWLAQVYEFLGWLQESLVGRLFRWVDPAGDGRRTPPPGTDTDTDEQDD